VGDKCLIHIDVCAEQWSMGFHRSSHAVWECKYHLVWSTKYRKKALISEYERDECKKVLRRAAEQFGMNMLSVEVDIDHIHLYIEIPPQRSVGSAVGVLKSVSAIHMFKKFPGLKKKLWAGNLWEASYFVRSVGEGVTADMVKKYIEHHAEHAQTSVQVELFPKGKSGTKR